MSAMSICSKHFFIFIDFYETCFEAFGTIAHQSLHKSWTLTDIDLFNGKVKFSHNAFQCRTVLTFQKVSIL